MKRRQFLKALAATSGAPRVDSIRLRAFGATRGYPLSSLRDADPSPVRTEAGALRYGIGRSIR